MSRIRESAKDEECTIQIFGICNHDPETTVFCHMRMAGDGMNLKHDNRGAYGCSDCHDVVDGRRFDAPMSRLEVELYFHEACCRTSDKLVGKGLVVLN